MKIGILTFHFATNYGAILQAFCLQEYLTELGHDVTIINYKPHIYEFSWLHIAKHPRAWFRISRILMNKKKDAILQPFREQYLNLSKKYSFVKDFGTDLHEFDVLISGSDQVLNPDFTLHGEDGNVSPAYWLGIGKEHAIRIGYAVSFGCEKYPIEASHMVSQWVCSFNAIGVREKTGLSILEQIGYKGYNDIVPDPTLLLGKKLFSDIGIDIPELKRDYVCVYMLRNEITIDGNVKYIDEKHAPYTMEQWLFTIANAKQMITNSYHGMIMAILAHVPFAVLLESGNLSGMNDRFYTLLNKLGISYRIANTRNEIDNILKNPIDFSAIDESLNEYRKSGMTFIEKFIP